MFKFNSHSVCHSLKKLPENWNVLDNCFKLKHFTCVISIVRNQLFDLLSKLVLKKWNETKNQKTKVTSTFFFSYKGGEEGGEERLFNSFMIHSIHQVPNTSCK